MVCYGLCGWLVCGFLVYGLSDFRFVVCLFAGVGGDLWFGLAASWRLLYVAYATSTRWLVGFGFWYPAFSFLGDWFCAILCGFDLLRL